MTENYILYKGDCLEEMNKIPDKSIDLLLTDPPYEIDIKGGGLAKKRDIYSNIEKAELNTYNPISFLSIVKPKLKEFHAYIFCSKNLIKDYIIWINENNLSWDLLIVNKVNPIPTKNNKYLSDREYLFFIREKGKCYFNNDLRFNYYRGVKSITVKKNTYGHPTEKNENLISELINVSSKENDIILDPYMGSGTTGSASINLNRKFIGIEKDNNYFDIAKRRIESNILRIF